MASDDLIPIDVFDWAVKDAIEDVFIPALEGATPKSRRGQLSGKTAHSWRVIRKGILDYEIGNPAKTQKTKSGQNEGKDYNIIELLTTGTNPHIIEPVDKKVLAWQKGSKWIYGMRVKHPGFAARLFLFYLLRDDSLYARFEEKIWLNLKSRLRF